MPDRINRKRVLQTLADRLPENLLKELFPDNLPGSIRDLLRKDDLARNKPRKKSGKTPTQRVLPMQSTLPSAQPVNTTCSLYTDGASRGNPGEAGAGIALIDSHGNELATRSIYLGKCTNNVAEYQALIAGLETSLKEKCCVINIFMDSELIVRQIEGRYKVKNEQLKPLFAQVKTLLGQLDSWNIAHIPRKENARADELANKGIDDNLN